MKVNCLNEVSRYARLGWQSGWAGWATEKISHLCGQPRLDRLRYKNRKFWMILLSVATLEDIRGKKLFNKRKRYNLIIDFHIRNILIKIYILTIIIVGFKQRTGS